MNKYLIPGVLLVLCALSAGIVLFKKLNLTEVGWNDYSHKAEPAISFKYPTNWGQPRIVDENSEGSKKFQIDFNNYSFSVNNGYYFLDIKGKRPTVASLLQNYENDKKSINEVKSYTTQEMRVDNLPATRVDVNTLNGKQYTDIYIYKGIQNTTNFILITADRSFVDEKTLVGVLKSFKIYIE